MLKMVNGRPQAPKCVDLNRVWAWQHRKAWDGLRKRPKPSASVANRGKKLDRKYGKLLGTARVFTDAPVTEWDWAHCRVIVANEIFTNCECRAREKSVLGERLEKNQERTLAAAFGQLCEEERMEWKKTNGKTILKEDEDALKRAAMAMRRAYEQHLEAIAEYAAKMKSVLEKVGIDGQLLQADVASVLEGLKEEK